MLQRGRSIAQGGKRARLELTFPRNKFHLVRGQITDVMRMVGAVGNYVFAVIGSPGPSKGKKSHTEPHKSASARERPRWKREMKKREKREKDRERGTREEG